MTIHALNGLHLNIPKICQNIGLQLLAFSFVVEACSTRLEFSWSHDTAGTLGYHHGSGRVHPPVNPTEQLSLRHTRSHRVWHSSPERRRGQWRHVSPVAVQSHVDMTSCVLGMNIVVRDIEILSDDIDEGVICFLVGGM